MLTFRVICIGGNEINSLHIESFALNLCSIPNLQILDLGQYLSF